jgi:hypothetical protein
MFVACSAKRAGQITVDISPIATPSESPTTVWVASTPVERQISEPFEVTYGEPPLGFTSQTGPAQFELATSFIRFSVDHLDAIRHNGGGVYGLFDGRRLQSGRWLNQDGDLVDKPCD